MYLCVSLLHDFGQHIDVFSLQGRQKDFSKKERKKGKAIFYPESPRTEQIITYLQPRGSFVLGNLV